MTRRWLLVWQRATPSEAAVTVSHPAEGGTILPTTRQGDTFFTQVAVNNSSSAQNLSLKITGVKNNVGASGEDAVTEITRTAFTPKTPETYVHDADGNLTADARWTYAWDAENRLITCETTSAAVAAGVPMQRLEFAYDAQGRRIQKRVLAWDLVSGLWTVTSDLRFLYDGWNLLAEFAVDTASSTFAVQRTFTWGLDLSGTMQGAGGVGGLLSATSNGSMYFSCYDGNGNVIGLVNASDGTLAAEFEYDPFGGLIKALGAAAHAQPFGFSTKYTDSETGLCYYGLRYYNASTGRWPNRDPIEEQGGLNLYGMVGNNPVNRIDPLGLDDSFGFGPIEVQHGGYYGGWIPYESDINMQVALAAAWDKIIASLPDGPVTSFSRSGSTPIGSIGAVSINLGFSLSGKVKRCCSDKGSKLIKLCIIEGTY